MQKLMGEKMYMEHMQQFIKVTFKEEVSRSQGSGFNCGL